jgi:ribonuclease HI
MTKERRKKKKYYAVREGHKVGVFTSWNDCLEAVLAYSRPSFCFFTSKEEALEYMKTGIIPYEKHMDILEAAPKKYAKAKLPG